MKILVVGSGAIGLRTAAELLRRGANVSIQSSNLPLHPNTCSMGAGGFWMPFRCNDERIVKWSSSTLDELIPFATRTTSSDKKTLVEITPALHLKCDGHKYFGENKQKEDLPPWSFNEKLKFRSLELEQIYRENKEMLNNKVRLPDLEELTNAGYTHAWMFETAIVDAPRMLQHLLDEVTNHPKLLDVDTSITYKSIDDVINHAKENQFDAVVNCAGLGAADLLRTHNNDDEEDDVVGVRGVLLQFDRKSCEWRKNKNDMMQDAVITTEDGPWGSEDEPCYMIPRGNILVVGGSCLKNDPERSIRDYERERLLVNAHRMGIDVTKSNPIGEWTGFRPYRELGVRLEIDEKLSCGGFGGGGLKVVHNYGHGGSGWTIYVGVAKEVASLLGL